MIFQNSLSQTLESFELFEAEKLNKIVSELKPSTLPLDPIPTSFFKTIFNFVCEEVQSILNYFLQIS